MPHPAPATGPARLSARAPGSSRRWWTELPLVLFVYTAYSACRLLARGDTSTAVDHGLAILRFEQRLHLNAEHPLNRLFAEHPSLGIPADFLYASLHYGVTPAILIWLWRRRPSHYRIARTSLLLATFIGLVGFVLVPTCPPRLLDPSYGFVDTMAQYASYGWWGGDASAPRGLGSLTNQYAAMPSLHVGWALWSGLLLWRLGGTTWAKAAGIAYPAVIAVVVMGTANHYFLDAVAGTAVVGLGLLLARPALRAADAVRERSRARTAPAVSGGCETSAGERIPRQPDHHGRPHAAAATAAAAPPADPAPAGDGAAATAR
ncbi:phosphatase PAP2 family protein [Streptomyces pathocidini]|uniref:phosphatase PAP2 family protein n=1 Tax=Streptomyces pathocidini TaxID=1650571 RepID=UPI0033C49029